MKWKYISRYSKLVLLLLQALQIKKTSANEQNALTDLQSCSTIGCKKYLSSHFHAFMIIMCFFYQKNIFIKIAPIFRHDLAKLQIHEIANSKCLRTNCVPLSNCIYLLLFEQRNLSSCLFSAQCDIEPFFTLYVSISKIFLRNSFKESKQQPFC